MKKYYYEKFDFDLFDFDDSVEKYDTLEVCVDEKNTLYGVSKIITPIYLTKTL